MATRAFEQPFKNITGIPGADLRTKQYYGVKFNSDGEIVLAGAGDAICGVLQEPNNTNEPARVMQAGISFCVFGAITASGAEVSMDAAGKFVPATGVVFTSKGAVDYTLPTTKVVGIAVVGAGVGEIGCILLK